MNTVLTGLLGLAACVGWLSGCAGIPSAPAGKTVVRFAFWGNGQELATFRLLEKEFEAAHTPVDVQLMHVPENYFQKLHILFAARLAPDVLMINNLTVPVYAHAGLLANLSPYWSAGSSEESPLQPSDFLEDALKALQYSPSPATKPSSPFQAAIPRDVSTLVVYVNQDLLQREGVAMPSPDWDWQEALQKAKALTRRDVTPKRFGWSVYKTPPLYWLPFVWSWGGQWFSPGHTPPSLDAAPADWNDANALAGLNFYKALRHQHRVMPSVQETGQATMTQLFLQQRLAFLVSGRWSVPFLRENAPFRWDVVPFPAGPAGSRVGVDATGYAISQQSKVKDAAWHWIAFVSRSAAQQAFARSGLIIPARRDVAESASFLAPGQRPAHSRVFLQVLETGVPTQTAPDWNERSEALIQQLTPAFEQPESPALPPS